MALRDYPESIAECSRALEWHAHHYKARLRRARAYAAHGDLAAATEDFRALIKAIDAGQPDAGFCGRTEATKLEINAELIAATTRERQLREEEERRRVKAEKEKAAEAERRERAAREAQQGRGRGGRRHGRGRGGHRQADFDEDDFSAHFGGASWFEDAGSAGRRAKEVIPAQPVDHYGVLGVSATATVAEVRKAYRALSLKVHPDKHGGCDIAAERFKAVAAAHEILCDPVLRREHDEEVQAYKRRWPHVWVSAHEGQVPVR